MQRDLLVTLANAAFMEQAKQVFAGAHFNARWNGDLMLLTDGTEEKELQWFRTRGIHVMQLQPICTKMQWQEWNYSPHPSIVSLKLHLFSQQFRTWRTIVYIDADTIIRGPLDALTNVRRLGAAKEFCRNLAGQFALLRTLGKLQEVRKRFELLSPAFNTGVLALRPSAIAVDAYDQILELYKEFGKMSLFGEQLILNLYFCGHWERLPQRYNSYVYEPSRQHLPLIAPLVHCFAKMIVPPGVILHFPRGLKPWQPESSYYAEWKRNRERAESMNARLHVPR